MSNLLRNYIELSTTSTASQVSDVLQSIRDAPPYILDNSSREELLQALLFDLQASLHPERNEGRLKTEDIAQTLVTVKIMGKDPAGSNTIATSENLSTLLALHTHNAERSISYEALRCVANALLLVPQARATWISDTVGGGVACEELLRTSTTPEPIFLASRILFLCTVDAASSGDYICALVEGTRERSTSVIDTIAIKLDKLTIDILNGEKFSGEAMTDLLKFTFNLLLHYPKLVDCEPQDPEAGVDREAPKIIGDYWSHRLDGILLPLLRAFTSLPSTPQSPLTSPLTHIIHSLITIPVSSSLSPTWFGIPFPIPPADSSLQPLHDPPHLPPTLSSPDGIHGTEGYVNPQISRTSLPCNNPASTPDVPRRAHDLLDMCLAYYMPGDVDPDDSSVRDACMKGGHKSLDDLLCPLVALIMRICKAHEKPRIRMRSWILPDDLDRTRPLEKRSDLLGRLLRLLASVYHPRLRDAAGEMLFAVCDSNAATLAGQVGYGNVAGFLYNKGIMSAPPSSTISTSPGPRINPITGTVQEEIELPEMTDEEKEREAERLFVLFERLGSTGIGKVAFNQNVDKNARRDE